MSYIKELESIFTKDSGSYFLDGQTSSSDFGTRDISSKHSTSKSLYNSKDSLDKTVDDILSWEPERHKCKTCNVNSSLEPEKDFISFDDEGILIQIDNATSMNDKLENYDTNNVADHFDILNINTYNKSCKQEVEAQQLHRIPLTLGSLSDTKYNPDLVDLYQNLYVVPKDFNSELTKQDFTTENIALSAKTINNDEIIPAKSKNKYIFEDIDKPNHPHYTESNHIISRTEKNESNKIIAVPLKSNVYDTVAGSDNDTSKITGSNIVIKCEKTYIISNENNAVCKNCHTETSTIKPNEKCAETNNFTETKNKKYTETRMYNIPKSCQSNSKYNMQETYSEKKTINDANENNRIENGHIKNGKGTSRPIHFYNEEFREKYVKKPKEATAEPNVLAEVLIEDHRRDLLKQHAIRKRIEEFINNGKAIGNWRK